LGSEGGKNNTRSTQSQSNHSYNIHNAITNTHTYKINNNKHITISLSNKHKTTTSKGIATTNVHQHHRSIFKVVPYTTGR
jgi:hypothetical protein